MKKILALLLAIVLLMTAVVACSKSDDDDDKDDRKSKTEKTEKEDDKDEEAIGEITFEGFAAIDNDECSIKIIDIDPENMWGYALEVELENKSSSKTYMYSVDVASINGVEVDPFFATEVEAGKKEKTQINFMDDLKEKGIQDYTDISLTFEVSNSDDWNEEPVAYETVHVYPYGEDKAEKFVRKEQSSDIVLVDDNNVTVIVTGFREDETWGRYIVDIYLVNKTDKTLMYSIDNAAVNNYEIDPFFATTLASGNSGFASVGFDNDDLEECGITSVEEIEIKWRIRDNDDWMAAPFVEEAFVIEP